MEVSAQPLEPGLACDELGDESHRLLARQRRGGAGVEHGQAAAQVLELVGLHAQGA
jgi:hypothetical protein